MAHAGELTSFHFEVFSAEEFNFSGWGEAANRLEDNNNNNIVCEPVRIENMNNIIEEEGINLADAAVVRTRKRNFKVRYKSEWSVADIAEYGNITAIMSEREQNDLTARINALSWWADVQGELAAEALEADRLPVDGLIWHYHPLKIMEYINGILGIDAEHLSDQEERFNTIVVDDEYFITGFQHYDHATRETEDVDITRNTSTDILYNIEDIMFLIRAQQRDRTMSDQDYLNYLANNTLGFDQHEIVCQRCLAAAGNDTPLTEVKLYYGIMEVLTVACRNIMGLNLNPGEGVAVLEAFVCEDHVDENTCSKEDEAIREMHENGLAVDVRPFTRPDWVSRWMYLYRYLARAITQFNNRRPGITYTLSCYKQDVFEAHADTDAWNVFQNRFTADEQAHITGDEMRIHLHVNGVVEAPPTRLDEINHTDNTTDEENPHVEVRLSLNRSIDVPDMTDVAAAGDALHHYYVDIADVELSDDLRGTGTNEQGEYEIAVDTGELARIRFTEDEDARSVRVILDVEENTHVSLASSEEMKGTIPISTGDIPEQAAGIYLMNSAML